MLLEMCWKCMSAFTQVYGESCKSCKSRFWWWFRVFTINNPNQSDLQENEARSGFACTLCQVLIFYPAGMGTKSTRRSQRQLAAASLQTEILAGGPGAVLAASKRQHVLDALAGSGLLAQPREGEARTAERSTTHSASTSTEVCKGLSLHGFLRLVLVHKQKYTCKNMNGWNHGCKEYCSRKVESNLPKSQE